MAVVFVGVEALPEYWWKPEQEIHSDEVDTGGEASESHMGQGGLYPSTFTPDGVFYSMVYAGYRETDWPA